MFNPEEVGAAIMFRSDAVAALVKYDDIHFDISGCIEITHEFGPETGIARPRADTLILFGYATGIDRLVRDQTWA